MATNNKKTSLNTYLASIPVKYITPELIAKGVCNYFSTTLPEITKKRRKGQNKREITNVKKIIAYLLVYYHKDKISLRKLGEPLGYDHSMMLHHSKNCQDLIDVDKKWREMIHEIMFKIAAPELEETNYTIKDTIEDPNILKDKRYQNN